MSEYNVDHSVVKKPGQDRPLTSEEVDEWLKCADDPMYFFTNYCYVVGPRGKQLFDPREYQEELLDDIQNERYLISNAPRQCGKCSGKMTKYTVRNKHTGEIYELTAEQFHEAVQEENQNLHNR